MDKFEVGTWKNWKCLWWKRESTENQPFVGSLLRLEPSRQETD